MLAANSFATGIKSASCKDLPTLWPAAAMKVFAIPPPTIIWSAIFEREFNTSHLGRPTEGEFKPEDSLQPVVDYLKDAGFNVRLEQDYLNGVDVKEGEIVVLETYV